MLFNSPPLCNGFIKQYNFRKFNIIFLIIINYDVNLILRTFHKYTFIRNALLINNN